MGPIPKIWRAFRGLDRRRTVSSTHAATDRADHITTLVDLCECRSPGAPRALPGHPRAAQLGAQVSDSRGRVRSKRETAVQDISLINLPLRAFSTVDSNWGPRSTPISLARFLAHSPTLRESR